MRISGKSLRLKERIRAKPGELNKLRHRITKFILIYFSQFCRLKLHGRTHEDGRDGKRSILCRWPQLVMLLYIYCTIRLTVWLPLQYIYDYHLLKMNTFVQSDLSVRIKLFLGDKYKHERDHYLYGNLTRVYRDLDRDCKHYRSILKSWGAPYINSPPFVIECPLLLLILITFMSYIHLTIQFNRLRLTEMSSINLMLDEHRERQDCQKMIDGPVSWVKNSSLNYLSFNYSLMGHIEHPDGIIRGNQFEDTDSYGQFRSAGLLQRLIEEHELTVNILDELNYENQLQPMNRSSKWIDAVSIEFNAACIGNLIYSFWFDTAILFWIPIYYIHFRYETEPLDILVLVEICILTEISVISTDFYLALYVSNSSDQLRLLIETTRQVNECIKVNEELQYYAANHDMKEQQMSELHQQLNDNLILSLMRYKVFLAQYRPVGRCFEMAAVFAFSLILVLPALSRVHLPYVHGLCQPVLVLFCVILMMFSDFIFIPIARFNSNAMRLYRTMWSLGAHVTDLVERSPPDGQCAYYQHTRWLILKELSHPEDLADQFAASAFRMRITYPNLVQIHYWYSMIIISGFAEVQSLRDLFGDRFDDPFGFRNHIL